MNTLAVNSLAVNRIDQRFSALRTAGRTGLVPFVTAGDPLPDTDAAVALLHALVAAGADLIELGMPFSDPMADGPAIQRADERALARHVGLLQVLQIARDFRAGDAHTPLVLMGYLNPIEIHGTARFAAEAAAAGVDGLLLVDAPQDDAALSAALRAHGLLRLRLVAPNSDAARMAEIAARAEGFVYFVSITGTTGAARVEAGAIAVQLAALRRLTSVPLVVGFGIRDGADAQALVGQCDAVVIGSALVEHLAAATDAADACARAQAFLAPVRAALDARRAA